MKASFLKKWSKDLSVQILIAMILGCVVGQLMGERAELFAPLGDLFIRLIKMLVVPLVVASLISGAVGLGMTGSVGRVGSLTFGYYLGTTFIAVLLGLFMGEVFKPGMVNGGSDARQFRESVLRSDQAIGAQGLAQAAREAGPPPSLVESLINTVPDNPLKALVDGHILQILFFCLLLGLAIATLPRLQREAIKGPLDALNSAFIRMIRWAMAFAPIGVFGMMAQMVGSSGFAVLNLVLKLFVVYTVTSLIHAFLSYPLLVKSLARFNPFTFIRKIFKAQLVAFTTSSSMATLPVTLEVCEEELEVSNETSSFVLPLGATINMDGNAIYFALVACFFSQIFDVPLGLSEYVAIAVTATIGSIGQAGVPGPSFLVVAVLKASGLPLEGLPLLYAVDRVFDMIRTSVNITGDASCAVIVDRWIKKRKNSPR